MNLSNSTYNAPAAVEAGTNHRKENLEHRNEVRWNDTVTYSVTSSITNKYNIDYDNKLEDDFEIIEKDEWNTHAKKGNRPGRPKPSSHFIWTQ